MDLDDELPALPAPIQRPLAKELLRAREGQLQTRLVPLPVVMADGIDDTAVAPMPTVRHPRSI